MFTRHFRHWPPALPKTLSVPQTSLTYNLEVSARRYPGKTALFYYGNAISYRALADDVERFAGWLARRAGVQRGDRVLLALQNSPQFAIAYYGILRADAVVVPVNPMLKTDELRYLAEDSGARVAVLGQELLEQWLPLAGDSLAHGIVAAYSDLLPDSPDPALAGLALPEAVAAPRAPVPAPLTAWLDALGADLRTGPSEAGPDDLAVLPYTSGTTGRPKGCKHPHRTAMATATGGNVWFGACADTVLLASLPMFHVTAMQGSLNGPLQAGATIVVMSRWDRMMAARLIERHRVTAFTGITAMVVDFLSNPQLAEHDLSSLTRIGGGGAAMPEAVAAKLESLLGLPFIEGYGLTETMAPSHINPPHRPKRQCAGIPFFDTDARVVDVDTGAECGPGQTGEIIVSGPQVFTGYWNNPQATAEAFCEHDGKRFFRTGDLGHFDEDGYFFITDRLKRMINAAGFKVWPAEVESMLYAHPSIAEACVISMQDAHRGESVKAVVVLRPERRAQLAGAEDAQREAQRIIDWAREKMAAYKVPRAVEFVDSLPKTATGKVFWRMLQEAEKRKWT